MKCSRCQQENPPQAKFCLECGAPVDEATPSPKSYADLKGENEELRRSLGAAHAQMGEALARETATSDILRVLGSSPTDAQPVFETIARSGLSVCAALGCVVFVVDGDMLRVAATEGVRPERLERFRRDYPIPLSAEIDTAQTVRDRCIVHLADIAHNPNATASDVEHARLAGYRTRLMVPMVRGDRALGLIAVTREDPTPFPDQLVELLRTFADQAVIAIENVRLFNELAEKNRALTDAHASISEALERQTATAEILRVISSSPTDVQPVLDAVVESAVRLCGAYDARLWQLEGDDRLVRAAATGPFLEESAAWLPLDPELPSPRAFLERRTIHFDVPAIVATHPGRFPALQRLGLESGLATPLLREGKPIGVLAVRRQEAARFSDKHVELIQTFADQAVIAIENVRLFQALEARNSDLTGALARQTATSEVLRVISQSSTDLQPVFDAIADNARRLLRGYGALVVRFDGRLLHAAALSGGDGNDEEIRGRFPMPATHDSFNGAIVADRDVKHIADIEIEEAWSFLREHARARGWRANLGVPMLRNGEPIGAITVTRREAGTYSTQEVELLKTFADQAVIAIENARLLNELQQQTQALTRSVERLTALGEVGQAVSSSLELETVLSTIVARAIQLASASAGTIWEYDEAAEEFRLRITRNADDSVLLARQDTILKKGEGAVGRLAVTHEPVEIPDITVVGAYDSRLRDVLVGAGTRALLAVPLLREGRVLGGLVMSRRTPGEFASEVVGVIKTFATQSALAIQNARLFREIEEQSRQLETVSRHKSEFLANMSHELRTPLNAIIGFSEVLGERLFGDLNEKQEEYLKDIHASGQHLLSLINDILDLSKIEAGRMELELTAFDLPTAIDNALTLVRERAARRGIALHQAADEGLGQIRGDERKLKQVLLNLLSNAIKFTPDGGRIDVRAIAVDGSVEVSVSDTGVGIAPEDQEAIFEEFRQVGTADRKVEGTGLGLALSRKFIELHGGRIGVQSQVGAGSTFTFTIPIPTGA